MRLIIARWKGDVLNALHVRDVEVELRAAVEAARLHRDREEPERPVYPLPSIQEGKFRDATAQEADHYLRWRVYENWKAMREVFRHKPRRRATTRRAAFLRRTTAGRSALATTTRA